ncbi:hypothetical protein FHS91_002645 [Sphingobium xanthum]|uniref:hypothetical protein n=1 Tax=Sphingobium xanthum TaxID=1387165 RepID=UPI001C8C9113|nr:hypothetical protein [Sphingobium xanthum]
MSKVDPEERLIRARERATVARLRFISSLQSTQRRLSFDRLKGDALVAASDKADEVRSDMRQALRRHPLMAASGVLGLIAVIFWRPARLAALYGMRGAQLVWLNRRLWRQIDDD